MPKKRSESGDAVPQIRGGQWASPICTSIAWSISCSSMHPINFSTGSSGPGRGQIVGFARKLLRRAGEDVQMCVDTAIAYLQPKQCPALGRMHLSAMEEKFLAAHIAGIALLVYQDDRLADVAGIVHRRMPAIRVEHNRRTSQPGKSCAQACSRFDVDGIGPLAGLWLPGTKANPRFRRHVFDVNLP